jgi:hypothetical protein
MEFASEMVVKAALHGQKMTEVPTTLSPDGRDRPPHLRSFRDGWRHLRFLLLLCPLWLYLIPAGLMLASGLGLLGWLTAGPRQIGGVTLDVHTMLLGSLCVLLGHQAVWFWVFSGVFGGLHGIFPPKNQASRLADQVNLERGLIAGGLLVVVGLALNLCLVGIWISKDLGSLEVQSTFRWAIWGFTTMVLGAQTIFGSFFLTMLRMADRIATQKATG